jgi:hypothetical protein
MLPTPGIHMPVLQDIIGHTAPVVYEYHAAKIRIIFKLSVRSPIFLSHFAPTGTINVLNGKLLGF